jgi:hypothetical protein
MSSEGPNIKLQQLAVARVTSSQEPEVFAIAEIQF